MPPLPSTGLFAALRDIRRYAAARLRRHPEAPLDPELDALVDEAERRLAKCKDATVHAIVDRARIEEAVQKARPISPRRGSTVRRRAGWMEWIRRSRRTRSR
jgi:hypothetical protein